MRTTIEMAREAGIRDCTCDGTKGCLERLVELVRADERRACAELCDDLPLPPDVARSDASIWEVATLDCAEAIRARGNT